MSEEKAAELKTAKPAEKAVAGKPGKSGEQGTQKITSESAKADNSGSESPWWDIKTSTELIVEGNNYFKKSEYRKAEISYRKALQKDPNNATAVNNLGVILNELGKYDEAIPILQKGINIDPKNAIAHYVLGKSLNQKGRFQEALPEAKIATELDPTDPIGYRTLGEAALGEVQLNPSAQNDIDTAIGALERANEIDDTHALTWYRLSQAYELKSDYQRQHEALQKAIELEPSNVEYRLHHVIALIKLKMYEEAVEELKRVLKLDPKNPEAQRLLEQLNKGK